ncbi:mitochondrial protein C2orf69 homolog [Ostrea edulis]|uniref:mitochondrial protein C2orf69 homolog n=1 Tax=Ostrea edulis TaxID=37623 RepID=UPI0024AEA979|nr:mitochondrial protein C2orf69 homolog [Ostrea edulis]
MTASQTEATRSDELDVRRLLDVTGTDGKSNDVIVCPSANLSGQEQQHVIFFGGDIQTYPEIMESGMHKEYIEYNLEDTARILSRRFPESVVFIVKPSKMILYSFSVYKNFLHFSEDGIPYIGHLPQNENGIEGLTYLVRLYNNARRQMTSADSSPGTSPPIALVGFSKGCVVLNQIMFEMFSCANIDDTDVSDFIERLTSVYWLDSGHVGERDAWLTDDALLSAMVQKGLQIFAHVTPYQVRDSFRKWIGKEEKKFVEKLKKLNGNITEGRHFFEEPGSIENHFKILKLF